MVAKQRKKTFIFTLPIKHNKKNFTAFFAPVDMSVAESYNYGFRSVYGRVNLFAVLQLIQCNNNNGKFKIIFQMGKNGLNRFSGLATFFEYQKKF